MDDMEKPVTAKHLRAVGILAYVIGLPFILLLALGGFTNIKNAIQNGEFDGDPEPVTIAFAVVGFGLLALGRKLRMPKTATDPKPFIPIWLYVLVASGTLWTAVYAAMDNSGTLKQFLALFSILGMCLAGIRYNLKKTGRWP